jgi:hypothetical protein
MASCKTYNEARHLAYSICYESMKRCKYISRLCVFENAPREQFFWNLRFVCVVYIFSIKCYAMVLLESLALPPTLPLSQLNCYGKKYLVE